MGDTNIVKNINSNKVKVTREDLLNMKVGDIIKLDSGNKIFTVQKVNDTNFEMEPLLKKQLQIEGLYDNCYIAFIAYADETIPFKQIWLPIYGRTDKYVTKWFTNSVREAVEQELSSTTNDLLSRVNN